VIELECGDNLDLIKSLDDGCVRYVLTDPPYAIKHNVLLERLAPELRRVLDPFGWVSSFCGNYNLPDWTNIMRAAGFYFRGSGWLEHTGRCQVRPEMKMRIDGKPIAHFSVRWVARPVCVMSNVVRGGGRDKRYHHWGQDVESAMHLIEQHTKPGDLVLDPFAGSGTVLVAAWRLGRRAIGYEIDPGHYERACERLDREFRGIA
jgi:DNA modification methylase